MMSAQEKLLVKEILADLAEIWNNLEDDLEVDLGMGEKGYATYRESHKAIKLYTWEILQRKYQKWQEKQK